MGAVLQLEVPPLKRPITLREFLLQYRHGLSAQKLTSLFHKNAIYLNAKVALGDELLKANDQVEIRLPYTLSGIIPEQIPLDIIHEERDFIVVNKPAGMACHPGLGIYKGTLLNALKYYFETKEESALENGLVHRLDKETSGLILVTKTSSGFDQLSQVFKNKKAFRAYHALVKGRIEADHFTVNIPVGRDPNDPFLIRCFEGGEGGKTAITHFRILERKTESTLLECIPETGRTHQIRLHLQHYGHPISGDKRYGDGETHARMYLHAAVLEFEWDGELYRFEKVPNWDINLF